MAYWIIRQKAINVFVPGALSCNDPLRKTLSSPAGWKRHLWRPIASKGLTKLSILPNYNVLGSFVQGIPAFRDFTIRDPRYFVILFQ